MFVWAEEVIASKGRNERIVPQHRDDAIWKNPAVVQECQRISPADETREPACHARALKERR